MKGPSQDSCLSPPPSVSLQRWRFMPKVTLPHICISPCQRRERWEGPLPCQTGDVRPVASLSTNGKTEAVRGRLGTQIVVRKPDLTSGCRAPNISQRTLPHVPDLLPPSMSSVHLCNVLFESKIDPSHLPHTNSEAEMLTCHRAGTFQQTAAEQLEAPVLSYTCLAGAGQLIIWMLGDERGGWIKGGG
jgi:hypothetical protein